MVIKKKNLKENIKINCKKDEKQYSFQCNMQFEEKTKAPNEHVKPFN